MTRRVLTREDERALDEAASTPIALVGMSCLFPKSASLDDYWQLICTGGDAITEIPDSHWSPDDYYDPDPRRPDRTYCTRGGFLPVTPFDPTAFGIPPNVLEATDTSQLLSLIVAKKLLEDAGYDHGRDRDRGRRLERGRVGVVLGVTGTQELVIPLSARLGHPIWRRALEKAGISAHKTEEVVHSISEAYVAWQENSFPGLLGNVVAGRIAARLDFGGTNCVVDAACASALGALHVSVMELALGRADVMITGGVDTLNDIFMYMCFSKTPALSPTGDARPFSADADGTVLGEGIGLVMLKRLADAQRDGDRIYALITGVGSSSDGRSKSIYAPRASGQARAIRAAHRLAGISPSDVSLIEAHGTGTKVGDVTEFEGLMSVFAREDGAGASARCALGSVKSQIGHTKAAAGVAGMIKTALALHHKVLPPSAKVRDPNPKLEIEKSPFYLNTKPRPWLPRGSKRRAGVSAFGFGGSNFHVVMEEFDSVKSEINWAGAPRLLAASGASVSDLQILLESWRTAMASGDASRLHRISRDSLSSFDRRAAHRLILVVHEGADISSLTAKAERHLRNHAGQSLFMKDLAYRCEKEPGDPPKLALLFPGQGSQYPGMGRDIVCAFPRAFDALMEAQSHFQGEESLDALIYPLHLYASSDRSAMADRLAHTAAAQPALGAIELGMWHVLEGFGVKPDAALGHSYGELVALCASGCFSPSDLHRISNKRGQLMAHGDGGRGAMLAVQASIPMLESLVRDEGLDLVIANRNGPRQGVLSGPREAIEAAGKVCERRGWKCRRLSVSAAFHSPLVEKARSPFFQFLKTISFSPGTFPVLSNARADVYPTNAEDARKLLADQLLSPVRFLEGVEALHRMGIRTFIEIGPKSVLTNLVGEILKDRPHYCIAIDRSAGGGHGLGDLGSALAHLAVLGHPIALETWGGRPPREEQLRMAVPLCGANHRSRRSAGARGNRAARTVPVAPARATEVPRTDRSRHEASHSDLHSTQAISGAGTGIRPGAADGFQPARERPVAGISTGSSSFSSSIPSSTSAATGVSPPSRSERRRGHPHTLENGQSAMTTRYTNGEYANGESLPGLSPAARTERSADGSPSPGQPLVPRSFLESALNVVREGLRTIQTLQEQTAINHQHFLEGQRQAQMALRETLQTTRRLFNVGFGGAAVVEDDSIHGAGAGILPASSDGALSPVEGMEDGIRHHSPHPPEGGLNGHVPGGSGNAADASLPTPMGVSSPPPSSDSLYAGLGRPASPSRHRVEGSPSGFDASGGHPAFGPSAGEGGVGPERAPSPPSVHARGDQRGVHAGGIHAGGIHAGGNGSARPLPGRGDPGASPPARWGGHPPDASPRAFDGAAAGGAARGEENDALGMNALASPSPLPPPVAKGHEPSMPPLDADDERRDAPSAPAAAGGGSAALPAKEVLIGSMLDVVAELTGYPKEMLSLDMDLESDLGIDSIKRVEILSSITERHPELESEQSDHLGELRTLGEIADALLREREETRSAGEVTPSRPFDRAAGGSALRRRLLGMVPVGEGGRALVIPSGRFIWLTDDQSPLARALAAALERRGLRVLLLPPLTAGEGVPSSFLDAVDPHSEEGRPVGVVLVAPESRLSGSRSLWTKEAYVLHERAFQIARRAIAPLREAAEAGDAVFLTLTRMDGAFGLGDPAGIDPIQGGLAGLAKTFAREAPSVTCRAVDIDPGWRDWPVVVGSLLDSGFREGPVELGLSKSGPLALELIDAPAPSPGPPPLSKGDVVVVTGGARGITAAVARALARRYQATLVLLGRSPVPGDEAPALASCRTEAEIKRILMEEARARGEKPTPKRLGHAYRSIVKAREIRRNLDRIRAFGSRVEYLSVDARDAALIKKTLETVREGLGPIRMVIHGAGMIEDKRIEDKELSVFRDVFETKVEGLRALLDALREDEPRSLVLFSSVAGRSGNRGQVDYAMANEVLNKVARREAALRPDTRVLALNWGPWSGGMVTPSLKKVFEARGIRLIPLEEGVQAFLDEVEAHPSQDVEIILGSTFEDAIDVGRQSGEDEKRGMRGGRVSAGRASAPLTGIASNRAPRLPSSKGSKKGSNPTETSAEVWVHEVSIETHPVLKAHRIGGHAVIPLALVMEWLGHAARRSVGDSPVYQRKVIGFTDLRVLGGGRLDGKRSALPLHFRAGTPGEPRDGVIGVPMDVMRSDSSPLLYRARVLLAETEEGDVHPRSSAGRPSASGAAWERSLSPYPLSVADVYREVLFHGPLLHVIRAIRGYSSEGIVGSLGRVETPPETWMKEPLPGGWIHDPSVLDAAFQLAILWCHQALGMPSLPSYIGNYRQYASFGRKEITIRFLVESVVQGKVRGRFEFIDASERILATMEGYECTADAMLGSAFRASRQENA